MVQKFAPIHTFNYSKFLKKVPNIIILQLQYKRRKRPRENGLENALFGVERWILFATKQFVTETFFRTKNRTRELFSKYLAQLFSLG